MNTQNNKAATWLAEDHCNDSVFNLRGVQSLRPINKDVHADYSHHIRRLIVDHTKRRLEPNQVEEGQ